MQTECVWNIVVNAISLQFEINKHCLRYELIYFVYCIWSLKHQRIKNYIACVTVSNKFHFKVYNMNCANLK